MVRLRGHMRTHYNARWSKSTYSNLRKIAGRIAVAVREDTTRFAGESMPRTFPKLTANRTRLRSVRRIDIVCGNPVRRSLVFNKRLQFSPGPAVQSRSHPLAHLDTVADVGQILQDNRAGARQDGLGYDLGADFVIHVTHMPRFPAGDSSQQFLCGLRTVALKALAQRQKPIALVSKLSTSIKSAIARRSGNILTKINPKNSRTPRSCRLGEIKHNMQVPAPSLTEQLALTDRAPLKIATLKVAEPQWNLCSSAHRKQRSLLAAKSKRARINMHRRISAKAKGLPIASIGAMCSQALRNRCNRVAAQLRAKRRELFTNSIVRNVMKLDAIAASVCKREIRHRVACRSERRLQFRELGALLGCWNKSNRNGALHKPHATRQVSHTPGILKERRFLPGLTAAVSASELS